MYYLAKPLLICPFLSPVDVSIKAPHSWSPHTLDELCLWFEVVSLRYVPLAFIASASGTISSTDATVPNIRTTDAKTAANMVLFMIILRLIWVIKLISELVLDRFRIHPSSLQRVSQFSILDRASSLVSFVFLR